jgi:hypothetical protein
MRTQLTHVRANSIRSLLLTATLALALAFTLSCSDSGGGNNPDNAYEGGKVSKSKISGVSQKGPFGKDTKVILYELDDKFNPTGKVFSDIIANDYGKFEIKGVELVSPYAKLEADGFYRNEVTGNKSAAPIKLYAIADIREKDNININILTHLEYYRVLTLIEKGKNVKDAKKQAQREILAVFGIDGDGFSNSEDMSIFGRGEGDAALLAISILLRGNLLEAEFTERLADFRLSLSETGEWKNEAEKTKMADWAKNSEEARMVDIKSNILSWGLSSEVSGFEKYVNDYWTSNYGWGKCKAENQGEVKEEGSGPIPSQSMYYYICDNNAWLSISKYEYCQANSSGVSSPSSSNSSNLPSTLFLEKGTGSKHSPAHLCMGDLGDYSKELCGADIDNQIEYLLVNLSDDIENVLWTPPCASSGDCRLNGDVLTCFDGIKINFAQAAVSVDINTIHGITTGSWTLYARVKDNLKIERVNIYSFECENQLDDDNLFIVLCHPEF